jgi:fructose-1,6-bisphosphatase I
VLQAVGDACKQINRIVQRAQTDDLYGAAVGADGEQLDENVQGEVQQKLDVVCNTIMLRSFCGCSSSIAAVASEEEDLPRTCCDVMVSCYYNCISYFCFY